MRLAVLFIVVLITVCLPFGSLQHRRTPQKNDPRPNPRSVVVQDNARFTVLTERLIRLEWSPVKAFQDAATWAFLNRNLPVPVYTTSTSNNFLSIKTPYVEVNYQMNNGRSFNSTNLLISFLLNGEKINFKLFGDYTQGNLYGTARTLDGTDGGLNLDCKAQMSTGLHCTYGLVSRNGLVLVDDTGYPSFDDGSRVNGWNWIVNKTLPTPPEATCTAIATADRRDCGYRGISDSECQRLGCCVDRSAETTTPRCFYGATATQDLYIFAHGHDYTAALYDFTLVSGKVPLPPRFTFGVYFSRYWAYNDRESIQIIQEYQQRAIPLDVLVTDMDWHLTFYKQADAGVTDQAGQRIGWTGFTWDPNLFPDPKSFLDWCKSLGLKNTLNLHPASGLQPWEEKYAQMAQVMGIDPKTNKYVAFNFTDPKFITNFFDIVLSAINDQGIDFWWLDWQQGEDWIDIPKANPTFWLNYMFFTYPKQWANDKRPILLHRWGGLGNHRYQIGFSGDVVPSWDSLNFQPFFTSRAANVAYGYWSHDLGGHTQPSPPELYTRWVQWGAFSPIFRTHCTKDANNDRRIWTYPATNYEIMRNAMLLRSSLVPYLYTAARKTYDTGVAVLSPLYYRFPEAAEAYQDEYINQYFFGDQIMVAPVTTPLNQTTGLALKNIWIPPGTWVEWFSGQSYTGPLTITTGYTLDEIPVFVQAGSIIPVAPESTNSIGQAQKIPETLRLLVFPPANLSNPSFKSQYSLYEDDGDTQDYEHGIYANTTFSFSATQDGTHWTYIVQVNPVEGGYEGMLKSRFYEIYLVGFLPPDQLQANGKNVEYQRTVSSSSPTWSYEGETLTVQIVNLPEVQPDGTLTIKVSVPKPGFDVSGFRKKARRLLSVKTLLDNQWGIKTVYQSDFENILNAGEISRKITYNPTSAGSLLSSFPSLYKAALNDSLHLTAAPAIQLQAYSLLSA